MVIHKSESQNIEFKQSWHDEYLKWICAFANTTPIQIRVYKDKIRLWNDGALPKEVPVEKLFKEHVSKPCNPNLANVFFKCGMVESWARGFEKIESYCTEENARLPVIDLSLGGVTARCFASDAYLKLMEQMSFDDIRRISGKQSNSNKTLSVNDPVNAPVNDPLNQVLETIKVTPNLSYNQIAVKIGKSPATVKRALSKLKELNLIKRVGSDKNGYWEILQ